MLEVVDCRSPADGEDQHEHDDDDGDLRRGRLRFALAPRCASGRRPSPPCARGLAPGQRWHRGVGDRPRAGLALAAVAASTRRRPRAAPRGRWLPASSLLLRAARPRRSGAPLRPLSLRASSDRRPSRACRRSRPGSSGALPESSTGEGDGCPGALGSPMSSSEVNLTISSLISVSIRLPTGCRSAAACAASRAGTPCTSCSMSRLVTLSRCENRYCASASCRSPAVWKRCVEIARQRLADDLLELRLHFRVLRGDRRHLGLAHQLDRLVVGLAVEQALAGEQLVQQDADGEDVGAAVDLLAAGRLGRQVAELALDHARVGRLELRGRLGQAEVHQLHLAALGDEDVGRRDVAVHDAELAPVLRVGDVVRVLRGPCTPPS